LEQTKEEIPKRRQQCAQETERMRTYRYKKKQKKHGPQQNTEWTDVLGGVSNSCLAISNFR